MPAIPGLRIMHVRRWALPVPLVLGLSLASGVPGAAHAQETPPTLSLDSLLAIPISAAARYDQATGEAAASITLVTRDDIEAYGFRSLWEILQTLGGFYATSDRVYNYVGVRGFGRPSDTNNRILLLVDGRPWNDITNYEADVSLGLGIPPEHMERIEVVRGPGSALYGGAAMLTVVNVITRSPRDGGGVVGASVGSFGMRRLGLSWAGELPGGVGATVWGAGVDNPGPDLFFPELAAQGLGDGRVVGRDGLRAVTGGGTLRAGSIELLLMASALKKGDPTA
ncbi:MAG: hypothetical protein FIA95_00140, partial [Gemmatimonadetes bacterium]|nr:hypothetical protein [Gemmatimonadota bacterium]